jgi:phospholipase/lecithinase/hemolysin
LNRPLSVYNHQSQELAKNTRSQNSHEKTNCSDRIFTFIFPVSAVTTPCLFLGCPNPEEYLFWDLYHPTTATHEFIADVAFQSLNSDSPTSVPEPTSGLGILAFGALGAGSVLKRQYRKASSTKGKSLSSLLS